MQRLQHSFIIQASIPFSLYSPACLQYYCDHLQTDSFTKLLLNTWWGTSDLPAATI